MSEMGRGEMFQQPLTPGDAWHHFVVQEQVLPSRGYERLVVVTEPKDPKTWMTNFNLGKKIQSPGTSKVTYSSREGTVTDLVHFTES